MPWVGRNATLPTVAQSPDYRVLAGVEELLPQMLEQGYLLGLVTGNVEAAAHIKLHRSRLNRFFSFGGYGSDSTDRGELTRMALQRAAVVSGGSVTRNKHSWSGTPPTTWPPPTPPGSPASGWPATTSTPRSSRPAAPTG